MTTFYRALPVLAFLFLLLMLPGCSPHSRNQLIPPPSPTESTEPTGSTVPTEPTPQNTTTSSLQQNAERSLQQRDYAQAEILLERAVRIEPGNSWLWYDLGRVKYAKGNFPQTIPFCMKSIHLSQDRSLLISNWQLIEKAHLQLGQQKKATTARSRWRQIANE